MQCRQHTHAVAIASFALCVVFRGSSSFAVRGPGIYERARPVNGVAALLQLVTSKLSWSPSLSAACECGLVWVVRKTYV